MSTKRFGVAVWVAAIAALAFAGVAAAQAGDNQRQPHKGRLKSQPPPAAPRPQSHAPSRPQARPDWAVRYPSIGRSFRVLPQRTETIRVGRRDYRYYSGVFYRWMPSGVYVVVDAPLGARVRHLPVGYVSFFLGPRRYFYANFTYYLWNPGDQAYVVVAPPEGGDAAVAEASKQGSSELFVYPKEGQSDEQRDRDRYECYVWASGQTGFDPSAENPPVDKASDYRRAMSACLEGRGYTVK